MTSALTALLQVSLFMLGLAYAARIGWAGPAFERSLTGDSRSEAPWRVALLIVAVLLVQYSPRKFHESWPTLVALAVTVALATAYNGVYWWTRTLNTTNRRLMDEASHQPSARRMIRCSIWTTVLLAAGAQLPASISGTIAVLSSGAMLFWLPRASELLFLAARCHRYGRTPWDDTTSGFDVFLSYRRLDANVVRRIAEELTLHGIRVWFDEYMVGARDRGSLLEKLRQGVERSNALAVFANDAYADSPWCCHRELEPFLDKRGAARVTPIGIPRGSVFEAKYGRALRDCRWILYPSSELEEYQIAALVKHLVALSSAGSQSQMSTSSPANGRNRVEVTADGCTAGLDLADFQAWLPLDRAQVQAELAAVAKRLNTQTAQGEEDTSGFSDRFRCMHRGKAVSVQFSAGLAAGPKRTAAAANAQLSDTQLMEYARDFAAEFFEQHGHRDLGVHTVIAFGFRHFAITYWNMYVGAWARKYSMILPHPRTAENFEVVVTFTHYGRFAEFLLFAPQMESIIKTLTLR